MDKDKRKFRSLEQTLKGAANRRRIQVVYLLGSRPEQSVRDIAKHLSLDFRTTSEHLRKLAIAGIVMKRYDGSFVRHALTDRGKIILKFCRMLE